MASTSAGSGVKSNPVLLRRLSDQKRAEAVESPKKRSCVQWDEDNLKVNEQIKAELDCQKIDEPDTPFVRSPHREEDSDEEEESGANSLVSDAAARVEKLLKEQKASERAAAVAGAESSSGRCTRFAPPQSQRDEAGGSAAAANEDMAEPGGFGSRFSDEEPTTSSAAAGAQVNINGDTTPPDDHDHVHEWEQQSLGRTRRMSNGEPQDLPCLSPPSGSSFSELPHAVCQIESSFEAKRKQHYDVRNALAMGRHLLEEGEDEDEEEEELNGPPPL